MAKGKNINGENWGVCGKMNTGKTHTTLELALLIQKRTNKPILIFDHTNNDSYKSIKTKTTTEFVAENKLPPQSISKISGDTNFEYFLEVGTMCIRDTILILDDCGNFFTGNATTVQMAFFTSPKNNRNDVFYQFHNFNDISPKLCRNLHVLVIKEQAIPIIPDKVPNAMYVNILHQEVINDNNDRDPQEIWAYRIYDINNDKVYWEDPLTGRLTFSPGREYFRPYLQ